MQTLYASLSSLHAKRRAEELVEHEEERVRWYLVQQSRGRSLQESLLSTEQTETDKSREGGIGVLAHGGR